MVHKRHRLADWAAKDWGPDPNRDWRAILSPLPGISPNAEVLSRTRDIRPLTYATSW